MVILPRAMADIVVAKANAAEALTATDLVTLNEKPRIWPLEVSPAGRLGGRMILATPGGCLRSATLPVSVGVESW
jgi:hypothetical protein